MKYGYGQNCYLKLGKPTRMAKLFRWTPCLKGQQEKRWGMIPRPRWPFMTDNIQISNKNSVTELHGITFSIKQSPGVDPTNVINSSSVLSSFSGNSTVFLRVSDMGVLWAVTVSTNRRFQCVGRECWWRAIEHRIVNQSRHPVRDLYKLWKREMHHIHTAEPLNLRKYFVCLASRSKPRLSLHL